MSEAPVPSHVIGFDDGPFEPHEQGPVLVVGAAYSGLRLEGVLSTRVERDGDDATDAISRLLLQSQFIAHLQCILTQGIAFAGFNVVDLPRLHAETGVPVVAVVRRPPDMDRIRAALLRHLPEGERKWSLIRRLDPPRPCGSVYAQAVGIEPPRVDALLRRLSVHGSMPEPLRAAHLIAGGISTGASRGRV